MVSVWREGSDDLKDCLGSVVVPVGSLSIGLCRHRALLFKVRHQIYIISQSESFFSYQYVGTPYTVHITRTHTYLCMSMYVCIYNVTN